MTLTHQTEAAGGRVAPVSQAVSERVKIARVLCIFFMTFVHVQAGIAENVYARDAGAFDIVYFILTRMIGLSSVSLLSIVSGYFIVSSLLKTGTRRLIVSKVKTLIVPLVSWNLAMLVLLLAYAALSGNVRDLPRPDVMGIVNALFGVTEWPLVVPLWFLRDLFVCCLAAPALYFGLRRLPLVAWAALLAFAVFGQDWHIMERPQLLLFFAAGMQLRIGGWQEARMDRVSALLTIGLCVMVAVFLTIRIERISLAGMETLRLGLDTLLRITMAAGFWRLTAIIRGTGSAPLFYRLEPDVFVLFCSHAILFNFAGIVFRRFFGNYGSDLFPITFFTLPVLAVVAAVIGLQLIRSSNVLLFFFNAGHTVPPWKSRPALQQAG
ncbi:acyltransferase family protein [Mesorhizobium xinjiangense]|uniref:acyltransferase family protein n=1 Tax=Mesorhizobium xinjiangense TaxID=2678685 RepID=UPI001F1EA6FA|nr:acyltransferase family protein [Mesorhizobium xinjiangense]